MTKFDIRLRRQQFTQGRIEQHKDYLSLLEEHQRRRRTRGMLVLVGVVIVITIGLLALLNRSEPAQQQQPTPADSTEHVENKDQLDIMY
jgi:hypothetical protein